MICEVRSGEKCFIKKVSEEYEQPLNCSKFGLSQIQKSYSIKIS